MLSERADSCDNMAECRFAMLVNLFVNIVKPVMLFILIVDCYKKKNSILFVIVFLSQGTLSADVELYDTSDCCI